MGIPIVSDILQALQKAVDWSFQITPKPVHFLLFLWLVVVIGGGVLPAFINMSGTHCVAGEKLTNDFFDIGGNLRTMYAARSITENNVSGTILVESNCVMTFNSSGTVTRYYAGGFCTDCETITTADAEYAQTSWGSNAGYCKANAYRLNESEKGWFKKWQCESVFDSSITAFYCEPPPHFYFSQSIGGYDCADSTCINATESSYLLTSLVEEGYINVLTNISADPPLVGIKCAGNSARFAFAGIDIFDYKLWLLLTVVSLIFWAIFKFT